MELVREVKSPPLAHWPALTALRCNPDKLRASWQRLRRRLAKKRAAAV
jgi:hypothetical protein